MSTSNRLVQKSEFFNTQSDPITIDSYIHKGTKKQKTLDLADDKFQIAMNFTSTDTKVP